MDALGIFVPFDGILPLQKWPNFGKIISPSGYTAAGLLDKLSLPGANYRET